MAFPFQIPDRISLEILSRVHRFHDMPSDIINWFQYVMSLLERNTEVHFGDLVTVLPPRNGNTTRIMVVSYNRGSIRQYDSFPNEFLEVAFRRCSGKKLPELTEIDVEGCFSISEIPYCPVVVPLGCYERHLGVFVAGSQRDRAVVQRNEKFFELLGMEMSLYLHIWQMERLVVSYLFEEKGEALSFEDLLTFKFKKFLERLEPDGKGSVLNDVVALVEKTLIKLALEKTNHKIGQAASLLGINRNTLRKKIHGFGLEEA